MARPTPKVPKEVSYGARNHDFRIFVYGVDVTSWVRGDPTIQIAGHNGVNSISFDLVDAQNFTIELDDIDRMRREFAKFAKRGVEDTNTLRFLQQSQSGEYSDAPKTLMTNRKVAANAKGIQESTSFATAEFFKANSPDGELLGLDLGFEDWLYTFAIGSTIFHKFDPIRVYRRWPYSADTWWYPAFTGLLTSARLSNNLTNGESSISVQGSCLREIMGKMRVQTNNIPQGVKIVPDVLIKNGLFADLILKANASHTLAPLSFVQMVALLTFGEILSTGQRRKRTVEELLKDNPSETEDFKAFVASDVSGITAATDFEELAIALFKRAGSVFFGVALSEADIVANLQVDTLKELLKTAEEDPSAVNIDAIVNGLVGGIASAPMMKDNKFATQPVDVGLSILSASAGIGNLKRGKFQAGYPDDISIEEWHQICSLGYDGTNPLGLLSEKEMIERGVLSQPDGPTSPWNMFVHMIVPSDASSIAYDLIEHSLAQYHGGDKGVFKREWSDRLGVLNELCSHVDYQFWITPDGDLVFEFPQYDFMPCDLGSMFSEAYVTDDETIDTSVEDEAGDVPGIVSVQGGISWEELAAHFTAPVQFKGVAWSPLLIHRYGVNEKTVAKPFISDPRLLERHARLELQKALAEANKLTVNLADRPFVLPNRPFFVVPKLRVGITGSVSTTIAQSGEAPSLSFDLTYVKRAVISGRSDEPPQFRLITGGLSSPVPYNQLYLQASVHDSGVSNPAVNQGSFTGKRERRLSLLLKLQELDRQIAATTSFAEQQKLIAERGQLEKEIKEKFDFQRAEISVPNAVSCTPPKRITKSSPASRTGSAKKGSDLLTPPTESSAAMDSDWNPSASGLAAVPVDGIGPTTSRDSFMKLISNVVALVNQKEPNPQLHVTVSEVWSQIRSSADFAGLRTNAHASGVPGWVSSVEKGKMPPPGPLGIGGITPSSMSSINKERAVYGLPPQRHPWDQLLELANKDKGRKLNTADVQSAVSSSEFFDITEQITNTVLSVKIAKQKAQAIAAKYGEDRPEVTSALASAANGPAYANGVDWYMSGVCSPDCDETCKAEWYEKWKNDPLVKEKRKSAPVKRTKSDKKPDLKPAKVTPGFVVTPGWPKLSFSSRKNLPISIVIHDTETVTAKAGIATLKSRSLSTHFVIDDDENATLIRLADPGLYYAHHTDGTINPLSIGIDMVSVVFPEKASTHVDAEANLGYIAKDKVVTKKAELKSRVTKRSWWRWAGKTEILNYSDKQIARLFELVAKLTSDYGIKKVVVHNLGNGLKHVVDVDESTFQGIIAHAQINTNRADGLLAIEYLKFVGYPNAGLVSVTRDEEAAAENLLSDVCNDIRKRAKYKSAMDADITGIKTSAITGVKSTVVGSDNTSTPASGK